MTPPRATLTMRAPFFIFANAASPKMFCASPSRAQHMLHQLATSDTRILACRWQEVASKWNIGDTCNDDVKVTGHGVALTPACWLGIIIS